jgi:hypothetical protein
MVVTGFMIGLLLIGKTITRDIYGRFRIRNQVSIEWREVRKGAHPR